MGLLLSCCVAVEGCAAQQDRSVPGTATVTGPPVTAGLGSRLVPSAVASASSSADASARSGTPSSTIVPPAQVGTPAASQRIRFVPAEVVLPGGARAPVVPASTVDGRLLVPERVQRVGWWDGGAQAGDPFGSVVVAGHVDSATEGIGFFVRLWRITPGATVVLRGGGHSASYRVSSVVSVRKNALATESGAFDQRGAHRLVLITCAGEYDAARGGYEDNLVVTATPEGPAR